jgi:hypothetical protein
MIQEAIAGREFTPARFFIVDISPFATDGERLDFRTLLAYNSFIKTRKC